MLALISSPSQITPKNYLTHEGIYLIFRPEMLQWSKRRHRYAFLSSHPHLNQIEIVATLGHQRESTRRSVTPVSADVRMCEMPKTNLTIDTKERTNSLEYSFRNDYLVFRSEMLDGTKRRHGKAFLSTHPHLDQIQVMATLGHQREGTWRSVAPVSTDKGMSKVPKSNLIGKEQFEKNAVKKRWLGQVSIAYGCKMACMCLIKP